MDVKLGGSKYEVRQAKLRTWLELESIRHSIQRATDPIDIATQICRYVSVALVGYDVKEDLLNLPWVDVALAYSACLKANAFSIDIPFLKFQQILEDQSWDYPNRNWWEFAHLLAKEYGWGLEEIAQMDVPSAFYMLQEIMIDHQFHREWEWSLSERSISYDEATKQSKFVPLPRPDWMKDVPKEPKKIKILKSMLPVGNVISVDGKSNVIN